MYVDAAREKKDVCAKDQERRHRFLKERRHETAVYVKGLQKHPLYMSPASPPRQGSGGVDSSDDSHISRRRHQPNTNAAISSAVGTSARTKPVGKSKPTKSSRFVQGVLQRMAEAAAAAAYPSADQTPSSSSYTASPPPPDLTPLGGVLGHHHQQQQHRNTSPPHQRQHLDDDNDNSSGVDELMIIRQTSSPPPSAILQRPPSSNRTPAVTFTAPGERAEADQ
ncbi:Hypothetical protein, putative [Bodo saltans]|uniref:Uncharacterized protein n=1 Tax=Bodo saltans TaxID=75058 RepID=A0A0S4IMB9_BODSA|nr:Hypothetical protein, putative [Bodo saltans]|eukprot:CUF42502.1 Hypothetical protein, putative [Bodo saltans]